MLFSYEELIPEDDHLMEHTIGFINTELDYYLCGHYKITIDELDLIPINKLLELRIYALFEDISLLDEQTTDLELWIEETDLELWIEEHSNQLTKE